MDATNAGTKYFRVIYTLQNLTSNRLSQLENACVKELMKLNLETKINSNDQVAISLGSRGIKDIDLITRCVITFLKNLGARPFIIPAMGSHGGATAEGQVKVLEEYGITEDTMGVPIFSSMQVDKIGDICNIPIYFDKYANSVNHIFIINKIRPHTLFHGDIESGLLKMIVIGLGKHKGALAVHKSVTPETASTIIKSISRVAINRKNVYGLGLIEDSYKDITLIKAMFGAEIEEEEPKLLKLAKQYIPKIPFNELHLLIIDEIGKDISGAGLDPNIVGRKWNDPFPQPKIDYVFVRDLSDKTNDNATGIGLADFTTTRLVEKMNRRLTYINCLTSRKPDAAKIPVYFNSDREVLENIIPTIPCNDPKQIKAIWIKDTSSLFEMYISEALVPLAKKMGNLAFKGDLHFLSFDNQGDLNKLLVE